MESVAVPARINAGNAVEVLAELRAAASAAGSTPLALDLSALQEFDSSALSLLLQLARERCPSGCYSGPDGEVGGRGQPLFLLNPPRKLEELADLYGVATMLFGASPEQRGQAGQPGQAELT